MERPTLEVADIFRRFGASYLEQYRASAQQRRVIAAITACRTAALGGHLERCDQCSHERYSYNSCRDRHCPKCGALAREQWVQARTTELLPIPYFHVVFTMPEFLRPIAWQNQAAIYNILFHSAAVALQKVAADPQHLGARIGLLAILHTWNQQLLYHPHIHCIVPGGGPSFEGDRWIAARSNFFLPVAVLSKVYRGIFMRSLRQAYQDGKLSWHGALANLDDPNAFHQYIQAAWTSEWVVYSKAPFAGPQQVVESVGRYVRGTSISNHRLVHLEEVTPGIEHVVDYFGKHANRVAITNERLVGLDGSTVTFSWQDRQAGQTRLLSVTGQEFIRRFLMHIVPRHFVRIRHYGFLANAHRADQLGLCRRLLQGDEILSDQEPVKCWKTRLEELTGVDLDQCPACSLGRMHAVIALPPQRRQRPAPQLVPFMDTS